MKPAGDISSVPSALVAELEAASPVFSQVLPDGAQDAVYLLGGVVIDGSSQSAVQIEGAPVAGTAAPGPFAPLVKHRKKILKTYHQSNSPYISSSARPAV